MNSPATPPSGSPAVPEERQSWFKVSAQSAADDAAFEDVVLDDPATDSSVEPAAGFGQPASSPRPGTAAPDEPPTTTAEPVSTENRLLLALFGARALVLGSTARDRLWGWLGPVLVAVLAAVLRLPGLGRPGSLVFDETYYVKQAYTLLMVGFDAEWPEEPNEDFEAGNRDVFLDRPAYVVHPPVGKWMIAAGMRLLGPDNPASWRLATAIVGILAVFLIARAGRHLFSSTLAGVAVGGLFAVDGAAIVHARTGLLDSFVMFWAVVAFVFLLRDRAQARRRLAVRSAARLDSGESLGRFGPSMGVRWNRLAMAVALGLGVGTKWSGVYFVAVFAVITVLWDASARRRIGVTGWPLGALVRDAIPAALTILPVVAATYLASWTGWFTNSGSYKRQWATENPGEGVSWLPPALRSLWDYHSQMWDFHIGLESPHTYQAHPLGWLIQWRPTSFFYRSQEMGQDIPGGGVCEWDKCTQAITSVGNPLIWWLAALALLFAVWMMFIRYDWRAVAVLSGLFAGWLPWLAYAHRTIFAFYSIAFAPFMYLTLVYAFVVGWEWSGDNARRRRNVKVVMWVTAVVIVVVSAFFYPIWTAINIPTDFWQAHMWLPSWI